MFRELEKFCTDNGLRCRITLASGSGPIEDAVRQAMSDYLRRADLVGVPPVRGAVSDAGVCSCVYDETLIELEPVGGVVQ